MQSQEPANDEVRGAKEVLEALISNASDEEYVAPCLWYKIFVLSSLFRDCFDRVNKHVAVARDRRLDASLHLSLSSAPSVALFFSFELLPMGFPIVDSAADNDLSNPHATWVVFIPP